MVNASILLPVLIICFKYSKPNILFEPDKILAEFLISFIYKSIAFSRALGKDKPFESSWLSIVTYSEGSLTSIVANLFSVFISPHSLPNERVVCMFKLFNIFILPEAKFSALEIL